MIHNQCVHILKIALLGTSLGLMPWSLCHAGLYKWTDENGKVHYGDRPPPVNTQYGHDVLSKQGIRRSSVSRELTREERLAAARLSEEEEARRAAQRELERIDRLLATSFPSFDSLDAARDDRLATLDDSIAYLESRREGLVEKRGVNTGRIQHFKRKNLDVPRELTEEAETIAKGVHNLDRQIAEIARDRKDTIAEFKRYSDRLLELLLQQRSQ